MAPGFKTGGRKKGAINKTTRALKAATERAVASGLMPLEYMLNVMRNPKLPAARRDWAANAAAPYIHPKLATLQSNVNLTGRLTLEALVNESIKASLPANDDEAMKVIEGKATERGAE